MPSLEVLHTRLTSSSKGTSWCQLKQMVEGLCYINERSLLHFRYLSFWQFMSLLRAYQSFPIIFKEVSCHLHCQEHSFLTSSRPVERAEGWLWNFNPSRETAATLSEKNTCMLNIFTHTHTCKAGMNKMMQHILNISSIFLLCFSHFHGNCEIIAWIHLM